MASPLLKTPKEFPFNKPEEWVKWKVRFQQYRLASGLESKSAECQVSTLLYCMGEGAEDVLDSTGISQDQKKVYQTVVEKFDEYFKVRKNLIFERAHFNQRKQEKGDSAELFITALHQAADTCEFGTMKEQMIRDRLVVGIRDKTLSERLQMEPELTLEKAKRLIRQREAVKEQGTMLKGGEHDTLSPSLDSVAAGRGRRQPGFKGNARQPDHRRQAPTNSSRCKRCGGESHPLRQCPAREVVCFKCNRKGHFRKRCLSKTVAVITGTTEDSDEEPELYLDTTYQEGGAETAWRVDAEVNHNKVQFKVDTGAEVTAISDATWKSFHDVPQLRASKSLLGGPDRTPLAVVGVASVTVSYKQKSCDQKVYVIRNLKNNLLGLPAIRALNLLQQLDAVETPIPEQYPKLFKGLGTFSQEYTIQLREGATPHAIHTPRKVALAQRQQVKDELQSMQHLGVISPVTEPTPWCAGMVVIPKQSGKVRICVDLKPLNESVMREIHPLPSVDTTLARLAGAKVFSKLDHNSGFWQVPLSEESRLLTTFLTPWGRYAFNKLPFGISSAPEHFQRKMSALLSDIEGVEVHIDDILVHGPTTEVHDQRLHQVLKRLQQENLTLNLPKCKFHQSRIRFLGHIIDSNGIAPDPRKTQAIQEMSPPHNLSDLRRFMGMVNHLNKFSPNIAELSQPLRELLSPQKAWMWSAAHAEAFAKVKEEISSPRILALYDPEKEAKISADASSYGLGAVLLQLHDTGWRPVAFASRALSQAESRYAQIEKEALALTWACERFSEYVLGKLIQLETDHKPLVPIMGKKSLDSLPPRVLRFRLRLMRYQYSIHHSPGKSLYLADTLSRAPLQGVSVDEVEYLTEQEVEKFVDSVVSGLPAHSDRLDKYRQAQAADPESAKLIEFCQSGWPSKHAIKGELKKYWQLQGELSTVQGLLLYGTRIVVPSSMRQETLEKIHSGHQGIVRCRLRVSSSVWWPGVSREVEEFIKSCPACLKTTPPSREPLLPTELPDHPWERVATDLFELKQSSYLLVVDYFSRYIEVQKMGSTTASSVIKALKQMFATHGIPSVLVSDNGPQYDCAEMKEFAKQYGFCHITTSPYYPQANGQAERAVRTAKQLLENSPDPYKALMSYRATPLPSYGLSPAELLMGRRIRTDVPQVKKHFIPDWPYLRSFRNADKLCKDRQKRDYERRHRARSLPALPGETPVWVNTPGGQVPGRVVQPASTPRSYQVEVRSGTIWRNRTDLRFRAAEPAATTTTPGSPRSRVTRSQDGTAPGPPNYLHY